MGTCYIAKKYKKHTPAKRIPSIPKDEIYADFYEKNKADGMIPLGYDTNDISSVSLSRRDTFCLAVGASEEKSISIAFNNLSYCAKQSGAVVWYFKTSTDMLCMHLLCLVRHGTSLLIQFQTQTNHRQNSSNTDSRGKRDRKQTDRIKMHP